jgi:hypothetical protein
MKIDKRSSLARRHRVFFQAFANELGGLENLSQAERGLVDQAAVIRLRIEQMRDKILSGADDIDDAILARLSNSAAKIMAAISAQHRKREPARVPLRERLTDGE